MVTGQRTKIIGTRMTKLGKISLLLLVLLLFGTDCKEKKSNNDSLLLLLLLGNNRTGDGCNLRTGFAICVPPGIAGE